MLLNTNQNSNDMLASRLKNAKKPKKAANVDISQMRHKADTDEAVPVYDTLSSKKAKKAAERKERPAPEQLKTVKPPKRRKEKKKAVLKREATPQPSFTDTTPDDNDIESAADFDMVLDMESIREAQKVEKAKVLNARISKIILAILIAACAYMALLIYGVTQTRYVYDSAGNITPEVLSVQDLHTLDQYNTLSGYYLRIRILYEKILTLDYKLSIDASQGASLARDYLSLLDDAGKLATDIKAAELDIEYMGIVNRMYELVCTHMEVYLQRMDSALEENNAESANQALGARDAISSGFATLTNNIASICQTTKGASNNDIFDWSPESFVATLGGES